MAAVSYSSVWCSSTYPTSIPRTLYQNIQTKKNSLTRFILYNNQDKHIDRKDAKHCKSLSGHNASVQIPGSLHHVSSHHGYLLHADASLTEAVNEVNWI